jgi:hypothetical protein
MAMETTMKLLRYTVFWTVCVAVVATSVGFVLSAEAEPAATKQNTSTLDDQLLEGLDNALLEGLDDKPKKKLQNASESKQGAPDRKPGEAADKTRSLDDELLGDLGGDDVGSPGRPQDPLVDIGRRMKSVASRLDDERLDAQTKEMQKTILDDLAALMQECKKQCQGSGSGKPGSKSGKGSQGPQAGKSPATQAPSDTARNSSEKLRNRATERPERGALVNAMKESWGNLPERLRQELSNTNSDAFLPKYELMLEKYFKRLAEGDRNE